MNETAWCYNCKVEQTTVVNGYGQRACHACSARTACEACGGSAGDTHKCWSTQFCGRCQRFRRFRQNGDFTACDYCDRAAACFGCGERLPWQVRHECSYTQMPDSVRDPHRKNDRSLYCMGCHRTRVFELLEGEDGKFRVCRTCSRYQTCPTCKVIIAEDAKHECPLVFTCDDEEDEDEDGWGENDSPYGELGQLEISLGHGAKLEFRLPTVWHSTVRNLSPRLMPGSTYRKDVYNAIMGANHAFQIRDFDTGEVLFQKAKALA